MQLDQIKGKARYSLEVQWWYRCYNFSQQRQSNVFQPVVSGDQSL